MPFIERFYLFLVATTYHRFVKFLSKRIIKFKHKDPADGLIRMNLGCGGVILKNYINVDVVPSRQDAIPDVLCDLKELVFDDNYADEILSVHVIEHFYRWEVENVLKEWMRVLKPGGKIIIECPNIYQAAKMVLKNAKNLDKVNGRVKESMWVFYGDPRWEDPYMIHRWGYSPRSLKILLKSVGFVNIRRRACHFKRKEPRDMRFEAFKPN